MMRRRRILYSLPTILLSGCISTGGDSDQTSQQTSVNSKKPSEVTATSTTSPQISMSASPPEIFTRDTHPVTLDSSPPNGWEWQGTNPIDGSDFELGVFAQYAASLDEEYQLQIIRHESESAATARLNSRKDAAGGYTGVHVGVSRGRFYFETIGGSVSGAKELLIQIEGLGENYINRNCIDWKI
jgi:hypothetical protein